MFVLYWDSMFYAMSNQKFLFETCNFFFYTINEEEMSTEEKIVITVYSLLDMRWRDVHYCVFIQTINFMQKVQTRQEDVVIKLDV